MKKQEIIKRYALLVIGLFFSAIGVAVTKHGALGVSPISSVSNILSCKFTTFSLGTWLIIWNGILIAGQVLLLRKRFRIFQLLQIPISFLFGYFTDFGLWCISDIPVDSYIVQIILVIAGIVILGFGISITVIADVVMNSGEAFVNAVSDISHKNFGNIKIVFDIGCVIASVILSLIFFDFKIIEIREGTIIAALLTGLAVKFFNKLLKNPLEKFIL